MLTRGGSVTVPAAPSLQFSNLSSLEDTVCITATSTHIAVGTSFGVVAVFDTTGSEVSLLDRISVDSIVANSPRKSTAHATPAHAITVMTSSTRMFFGGNEDGEVFAFALDDCAAPGPGSDKRRGERLEAICKFPPAVLGTESVPCTPYPYK